MEIKGENFRSVISMIGVDTPDHQKYQALIGRENHCGCGVPSRSAI
jgi:hypothetical protein